MKSKLELRMYGLVNYQFGGSIHAGIQFGHSVIEYSLKYGSDSDYQDWAKNYKTFIILNGGTTNDDALNLGTMQNYVKNLEDNGVQYSIFREPDINNSLTAITFLVEEQVFNKEKYPDFEIGDSYEEWSHSMGGEKNIWLRQWLRQFRLA